MKKVLIFRDKLLPYSETFIKSQAESLKSWDYMFLTSKVTHQLSIDESRVILIPKILKERFVKKNLGFLHHFFYKKFIKKLKEMHFDLLHAHFGTDAIKVAEIANDLNLPLVVTLHGFDINIYKEVWESGARGSGRKQYPQQLLALAQNSHVHFIAVSQAIKQTAISFGIPQEKITVKYIGININKFKPVDIDFLKSKTILFVGRMIEKKGSRLLISAFAKVYEKVPEAKLIMIGDGEELEENKKLAIDSNLPVAFVGVKSTQEIVSYLNHARVFCLPSITAKNGDAEGLPMVILEAQACGVPVVTSARGGATEGILHGETGFAFAEGEVGTLSKYLITLLEDDAIAQSMSIKAIELSREKFDLERCTEALESFYDEI